MDLDNLLNKFCETKKETISNKIDEELSTNTIDVRNLEYENYRKHENPFTTQYFKIYNCRQRELSHPTRSRASKLWPSLTITNVSNQQLGEQAVIVGTIWKDVKSKISYLKTLEQPSINDLYIDYANEKASLKDEVSIEDETGRRLLEFEDACFTDTTLNTKADGNVLVTGSIVGLNCCLTIKNTISVKEVLFPGLIPQSREQFNICPPKNAFSNSQQKNKMDLEIGQNTQYNRAKGDIKELLGRMKNSGYKPNLIAFTSEQNILSEDTDCNTDDFELFVDWCCGMSSMPELAACVKNLAIIGNLINIGSGINLSMISSYHHEAEFNTMFGNMSKAMQKADSVLAKLAAKGIS